MTKRKAKKKQPAAPAEDEVGSGTYLEAVVSSPGRDPWLIQKDEPARGFEAFTKYRDMGAARSHAKVARELGKATQLMNQWSRRWGWVSRVTSWDARQSEERNAELIGQARGAVSRQALMGRNLSTRSYNLLTTYLEAAEAAQPGDDTLLAPSLLVRMLEAGVHLEANALGLTGIKPDALPIEQSDPVDWIRELIANPETRRLAQQLARTLNAAGPDQPGGPS